MDMESSKMLRKCFLCTKEFEGSRSGSSDNLSITESSFMLNQILELPKQDVDDLTDTDTDENYMLRLKFQSVCYCSECFEIISNLSSLAAELEILEEKVSTEKRNVVNRLRQSSAKCLEKINGPPGMLQILRTEIICEIDKRARSKDFSSSSEMKQQVPLHSISTQTDYIYDRQSLVSEDRILNENDEDDSGANVGSTQVLNMNIIYFKKEKNLVETDPTVPSADPLGDTDVANLGIDTEVDDMEVPELIQNKSYICGTCDEIFDDYPALEVHDSAQHKSKNKRKKSPANAEQNIMEKRKKTVRAYKKRDRTTGFYQPKECEECGKILSNHAKWKDHVLTLHRREGNHKCKLCDYNTQFPAALKRHMISRHSEARNFECDVCKKTFKRSDHLQCHQKVHEVDASFKCVLCPAKFVQAASLQDHYSGQYCSKMKS